jgi:hypothetical protein
MRRHDEIFFACHAIPTTLVYQARGEIPTFFSLYLFMYCKGLDGVLRFIGGPDRSFALELYILAAAYFALERSGSFSFVLLWTTFVVS